MQQNVSCKNFLSPELVFFFPLHHVAPENTAEIHVYKNLET